MTCAKGVHISPPEDQVLATNSEPATTATGAERSGPSTIKEVTEEQETTRLDMESGAADATGVRIEAYSAFTHHEKWIIVGLAAYASWFSTASSFIYFPALTQLSRDFGVSVDDINLTVTSYMAIATVAPTLVGDAADVLGRRPLYILTLGIYMVANILLANAKTFPQLLGFRVVQALGVSGVMAIGYGVVTDVASPAERGTFVSAVSFAVTIAPSLGPILGGALSYVAGWPWIFWFLVIAGGLCLALITFFLPETSRSIVGNGTVRPARHLRLPFLLPKAFPMQHYDDSDPAASPPSHGGRMPNPVTKALRIMFRKDNFVLVLAGGFLYAVYTCVAATISTRFIETYRLNQWQAGIIYLPFGLGGTVSTFLSGWLMDRAYRRMRLKMGLSTDKARGDDLDAFPTEKARLSVMWVPMTVSCLSIVAFGWALHFEQHIALPLAFQFVAGFALQLTYSIFNTLLVDINHRCPSAAHASTSLVRCAMAAVAVAFFEDLVGAIGVGWTFSLTGGLCLVCMGLFVVDYYKGYDWRKEALAKDKEVFR